MVLQWVELLTILTHTPIFKGSLDEVRVLNKTLSELHLLVKYLILKKMKQLIAYKYLMPIHMKAFKFKTLQC